MYLSEHINNMRNYMCLFTIPKQYIYKNLPTMREIFIYIKTCAISITLFLSFFKYYLLKLTVTFPFVTTALITIGKSKSLVKVKSLVPAEIVASIPSGI